MRNMQHLNFQGYISNQINNQQASKESSRFILRHILRFLQLFLLIYGAKILKISYKSECIFIFISYSCKENRRLLCLGSSLHRNSHFKHIYFHKPSYSSLSLTIVTLYASLRITLKALRDTFKHIFNLLRYFLISLILQ